MRVPTPNENNMDNGWQCTRCQSQLSRNRNKTERDFRRFSMHSPPGMRWSGHSDNSFSYAIRWNRMIVLASKTQAAPRVTRIGIYGLGHRAGRGVWGTGRWSRGAVTHPLHAGDDDGAGLGGRPAVPLPTLPPLAPVPSQLAQRRVRDRLAVQRPHAQLWDIDSAIRKDRRRGTYTTRGHIALW